MIKTDLHALHQSLVLVLASFGHRVFGLVPNKHRPVWSMGQPQRCFSATV